MDLNRTIYIGRDDSISEVLRRLLALADDPREVQMEVGTRTVLVSDAVGERFDAQEPGHEDAPPEPEPEQAEQPEQAEAEPTPEETEQTAPARKRAPRKAAAPAAEENA